MTYAGKRWYRSRKNQILLGLFLLLFIVYFTLYGGVERANMEITRRDAIKMYIEKTLQEALRYDKGTGCDIPKFDAFSPEVMKFDKSYPKIQCKGKDWVKCYLSECRVLPEILSKYRNVVCHYTDIIYESDWKIKPGRTTEVHGADVYQLMKSDHVTVRCSGKGSGHYLSTSWAGYGAGFRPVPTRPTPPGKDETYNVLIFGFDSTSRHGFMRKMPKSYKYLRDEMNATILEGYNIVGDGTPAALFPILTGKTELELPDVRRSMNKDTLDDFPFIFKRAKEVGYRTAYFEDMPGIGTFQYRFNGFKNQPADHYLRAYMTERLDNGKKYATNFDYYCVGDTPSYKVMTNLTEQFMMLPDKKFIFNFIADITHNDFNRIETADEDTKQFLEFYMNSKFKENTLFIMMGDHGPRYATVRHTFQGKLEERLPLMALRLPERLIQTRPDALSSLVHNVGVLSTPHDIHATILDVMDLRNQWNPYKIQGADLTRALTLLEPIPSTRSCSEAGVEPHWCACLTWSNVSSGESMYRRAADTLLKYINEQTDTVRSKCAIRTLTSIDWVIVHKVKDKVAKFVGSKDSDGYTGRFQNSLKANIKNTVQVKMTVGPGIGVYEASLTHVISTDELIVNPREISRINKYNDEPHCISATLPHLNPYCYCND